MIFPTQVAQRLIVRGPNGEIIISVRDSNPVIEFRTDPTSEDPNAIIEYSATRETLMIETDYVRSEYGSQSAPQPAWYVRVQQARGIMLDNTDDVLKATDGNILDTDPELWTTITSFSNGWAALAGFTPMCYRDPTGRITLSGKISPGGVTADGTTICTLPSTHRPAVTFFGPTAQDNAPYNRPALEIQSSGIVRIFNWSGGAVSLSPCSFYFFNT